MSSLPLWEANTTAARFLRVCANWRAASQFRQSQQRSIASSPAHLKSRVAPRQSGQRSAAPPAPSSRAPLPRGGSVSPPWHPGAIRAPPFLHCHRPTPHPASRLGKAMGLSSLPRVARWMRCIANGTALRRLRSEAACRCTGKTGLCGVRDGTDGTRCRGCRSLDLAGCRITSRYVHPAPTRHLGATLPTKNTIRDCICAAYHRD